jgi:hypothetical protein
MRTGAWLRAENYYPVTFNQPRMVPAHRRPGRNYYRPRLIQLTQVPDKRLINLGELLLQGIKEGA